MTPETHPVDVSIVIRAFNEEKFLPGLMRGIEEQSLKNHEVILVDSGSYDNTRKIAEAHGARVILIKSDDFTFGFSLNEGIRAARGKWIVIVSAHTKPCDKDWLKNLVAPFSDPGVVMTFGRQLGTEESKYCELRDFDRIFGPSYPGDRRRPELFVNNANSAILKEAWDRRPFDETLTGLEDIAWARTWVKKGRKVVYVPEAPIYHIHEETWPQILHRHYREAVAFRKMGIQNRKLIPKFVATETGFMVSDLWAAFRDSRPARAKRLGEIIRFRYCKIVGTVQGLLAHTELKTRQEKLKAFFSNGSRQVVIYGPNRVLLENRSLPNLKPSEVLIRVAYTGICGTDREIYHGTLGYYHSGMAQYPIVPGHEFSGTVVGVGAKVSNLKDGDRVVVECIQGCGDCASCKAGNGISCKSRKEVGVLGLDGAYSDFMVAQAKYVHSIPENLDLKTAVLCEPVAVSLKGLRKLKKTVTGTPSSLVCGVVGAGPLGLICAKLLESEGYRVTVFDKNPDRLRAFEGTKIQTSRELGDLGEFDAIVEASGNKKALADVLKHTRPGTALLLLGLPYGAQSFSFEDIVAFDKTVIGSVGSGQEDFKEALKVLTKIDLKALTETTVPLEEYSRGWEMSEKQEAIKVLLEIHPTVPTPTATPA